MTEAKELYRRLSLVRQAEMKIVEVYPGDVMQCPVHLSVGQESVAVALLAHLTPQDPRTGTHRSHALYLAGGGDLTAFFAELLGRTGGCSGGFGGSMHLIDLANGLVGTSSIVGGAVPIAVGLAMAIRRPRVAAILLGDAAADQGVFHEAINFAQLRRVPAIFMCENNRYSVYTPTGQRRAARPSDVAKGFGLRTMHVPIDQANDVFRLHELLAEPIAEVRAGAGPLFVECDTVRRYDHNGVRDDIAAGFRPMEERELFDRYCPITLARRQMDAATADAIDDENRKKVEAAYTAALASKPTEVHFAHHA